MHKSSRCADAHDALARQGASTQATTTEMSAEQRESDAGARISGSGPEAAKQRRTAGTYAEVATTTEMSAEQRESDAGARISGSGPEAAKQRRTAGTYAEVATTTEMSAEQRESDAGARHNRDERGGTGREGVYGEQRESPQAAVFDGYPDNADGGLHVCGEPVIEGVHTVAAGVYRLVRLQCPVQRDGDDQRFFFHREQSGTDAENAQCPEV